MWSFWQRVGIFLHFCDCFWQGRVIASEIVSSRCIDPLISFSSLIHHFHFHPTLSLSFNISIIRSLHGPNLREREKKSAVKIQNSEKIFKAEATFVSVLQGLQGLQGLEDLFGFLVAPFCRLCLLLLCPCQLKHCLLPADGDQLLKWRAIFWQIRIILIHFLNRPKRPKIWSFTLFVCLFVVGLKYFFSDQNAVFRNNQLIPTHVRYVSV